MYTDSERLAAIPFSPFHLNLVFTTFIMHIFKWLLLAFLLIPLIEIYLLIKVGGIIGALPTVFLVVFTAVLGAALLRYQGLNTVREIQGRLQAGGVPAVPLLEGLFLVVAGALLLTPGFFTDAVGFALLVPPVRRHLAQSILAHGIFRVTGMHPGRRPPRQPPPSRPSPRTIDGEYRRDDE